MDESPLQLDYGEGDFVLTDDDLEEEELKDSELMDKLIQQARASEEQQENQLSTHRPSPIVWEQQKPVMEGETVEGIQQEGREYRCKPCNFKFKTTRPDAIKRHWISKHEKIIKLFQCKDCEQKMIRKEDLINHGKRRHGWDEDITIEVKKMKGEIGENLWYKSPKGMTGPAGILERAPMMPESVPMMPESVPMMPKSVPMMPESVPMMPESVPMMPESVPMMPESVPMMQESVPMMPKSVPMMPKSVPTHRTLLDKITEKSNRFRDNRMPESNPGTVAECKVKLKQVIKKRDLIIKEVDELHLLEKQLRMKEKKESKETELVNMKSELNTEKIRRMKAEERVQELEEENERLKKMVQYMIGAGFQK